MGRWFFGRRICKKYKVVIKFDLQMKASRGNREIVPVRGGVSLNSEPSVPQPQGAAGEQEQVSSVSVIKVWMYIRLKIQRSDIIIAVNNILCIDAAGDQTN